MKCNQSNLIAVLSIWACIFIAGCSASEDRLLFRDVLNGGIRIQYGDQYFHVEDSYFPYEQCPSDQLELCLNSRIPIYLPYNLDRLVASYLNRTCPHTEEGCSSSIDGVGQFEVKHAESLDVYTLECVGCVPSGSILYGIVDGELLSIVVVGNGGLDRVLVRVEARLDVTIE
jgi:hypothetical protein